MDNINADATSPASASWVFDISGGTSGQLRVTADLSALGDFEASDSLNLTAQIDSGAPISLFAFTVDENGSQDYTLGNGTVQTLADPLLVDGNLLNNTSQTLVSDFGGSGSNLTITLTANMDGGSEGFAMKELQVYAVPEPSTIAAIFGLVGLGIVLMRRRRR